MLKRMPALLIVIGLIGLTTAFSAAQKVKPKGMGIRREIVNVAVKRPSHVMLKPTNTFNKPTVTATYKSSDGKVTSTFDGVVRRNETATTGTLIIRLNCKSTIKTAKKPKDATTTGDLTVTLTEGCPAVTETIPVSNVLADDDPDACP